MNLLRLVTVSLCIAAFLSSASAASAAPKTGWGFGVADESGLPWSGTTLPIQSYFSQLQPKIFRLQVSYDAWTSERATQLREGNCNKALSYRDEIRTRIETARALGAQHILVTFAPKYSEWVETAPNNCGPLVHGYTYPTASQYKQDVEKVVEALGSIVDSWSPANEPNAGVGWMPGTDGATRLAAFSEELDKVLDEHGGEMISPEFVDKGAFIQYINDYKANDGHWGSHIGFHPYKAVEGKNVANISDLIQRIPSNLDVWFTEVGAHFEDTPPVDGDPVVPGYQESRVNWLISQATTSSFASRIARVYYYNVWANGSWDTALIANDGTVRDSFNSWCLVAHGGNYTPACPTAVPIHRDTVGVFSPGSYSLTNSNFGAYKEIQFSYLGGIAGDLPVFGDWDGNGTDTPGFFRGGYFILYNDFHANRPVIPPPATNMFNFGLPGDKVVVGDWDGNGKDGIGVYRNGYFYLRNSLSSGAQDITLHYGNPGDNPIAGDWNNDGIDTVGVHRPPFFYLKNSNYTSGTSYAFEFGLSSSKAVAGDWNGDGADGVGVFGSTGFALTSSITTPGIPFQYAFPYGLPGQIPVAGNWDGRQ